ncbi:MAG: DUF4118 domain-containing protein [Nitrospira sp.]
MTLHTTVRADNGEQRERIGISRSTDQDKLLVETTAQEREKRTGSMVNTKTKLPLSIKKQYGVALGSTLIAFLLCIIAESSLGDTQLFAIFLVAIVVTTWCGGIGASLTALSLGALLWNWFFVNPRYAFSMGNNVDQVGIAVYLTTGIAVIGYAQTWRWAWKQSEETGKALHRESAQGTFPKASHHA